MIDKDLLPQICVYSSLRKCICCRNEYIQENHEKIKSVSKLEYPLNITLNNGVTIYFMPMNQYRRWCMGRTYRFYGKDEIYRNNRKLYIKEEKECAE